MKRALNFGIFATVVVALPWLAATVAANLQAFPPPVPSSINIHCVGGCSTLPTGYPLVGQGGSVSFQLALVALALMFVSVSLLAWRRGVRSGYDSLWTLPALLLFVGLSYALLTVIPSLERFSLPRLGIDSYAVSYLLLSLIVIAGGMGLIWFLSRSVTTRTLPAPLMSGEVGEKAAVATVIQRAINSLRVGSDPRSTIIKCYKSMEEILQGGGVVASPSLTAREFETASRDIFLVEYGPIHRLTALFERARYSEEEIDLHEASEAKAVLSELGEEVNRALVAR
jgi:hypothetical protein